MNGDAGIIRTLETPLYVTAIRGAKVHCLDRDGMPRSIDVVTSDYMFKQALLKKDYRMVVDMIRKSSLVGQSIIAYLKHKGYPEVALHFVTDPAARFELAIECGNLDVALETARVIDRPQYWRTLADEALQLGRISTAELAYLRIKAYDKLAFIYLLAGLPDKLAKLSSSGVLSPNAHFQAALLLGDPKQRASLLADAGQLSLAYLTVKSHGIDDSSLTAKLSSSSSSSSPLPDIPIPVASTPLTPPTPLFSNSQLDWPMLHISRGIFDSLLSAPEDDADIDASGWADDSLLTDHGAIDHTFATDRDLNQDQDQEPQLSGWGVDADLDGLGSDIAAKATAAAAADYVPPNPLPNPLLVAARSSKYPVDLVAAGHFDAAMSMLHSHIAVSNFAPLKPIFLQIYSASRSFLPASPGAPHLSPLISSSSDKFTFIRPFSLHSLLALLQSAYKATTAGKFADAIVIFRNILLSIPFLVVSKKSQLEEAHQLISICREYILGLSIEKHRRDSAPSSTRLLELAAYFTHCSLQPVHEQLALQSAMSIAYKLKCYKSAASFANRLLNLGPSSRIATQANQILVISDRNPNDALDDFAYDPYNPFDICASSYVPIYKGHSKLVCHYCAASYSTDLDPKSLGTCTVCLISKIGDPNSTLASGLVLL